MKRWLALLCLCACQAPPPAPAQAARAPLATFAAQAADELVVWQLPGEAEIAPADQRSVSAPGRAVVETVAVRPGDVVAAGQILVTLRLPDLELAAAKARVLGQRMAAQNKWLGQLRSLRGEGLAMAAQVREAELLLAELGADRALAESQVRAAALPDEAMAQLADHQPVVLRAMAPAAVQQVAAVPGQVVDGGALLCALAMQQRQVRVRVRALQPPAGHDRARFLPNGGAPVQLAAQPTATLTDPRDGNWQGWYVPQDAAGLAAGLRGAVQGVAPAGQAVAIPSRALRLQDTAATVFVVANGHPKAVTVQLLLQKGDLAWVSGLKAGAEVAADAAAVAGEH